MRQGGRECASFPVGHDDETDLPSAHGLYDPRHEHDACGLGFVADLKNRPRNKTVELGLEILRRLAHRGAAGSDPASGDGAGILVQLPHR